MLRFKSMADLASFLKKQAIPIHTWDGISSKTLADLWREISEMETKLMFKNGMVTRCLTVAAMLIQHKHLANNQVLWETKQLTHTGQVWIKNNLPGGKVKAFETPRQAAWREAWEELEINVKVNQITLIGSPKQRLTTAFHGLTSLLQIYQCQFPPNKELPTKTFSHTDPAGNTSVFEWRTMPNP